MIFFLKIASLGQPRVCLCVSGGKCDDFSGEWELGLDTAMCPHSGVAGVSEVSDACPGTSACRSGFLLDYCVGGRSRTTGGSNHILSSYSVASCFSEEMTYMRFYLFFRLIFGTLYPAYASYKAVRTKNVKEYVSRLYDFFHPENIMTLFKHCK